MFLSIFYALVIFVFYLHKKEIPNLMRSNTVNISTSMSSSTGSSNADKAVDGQKGPNPETCNCCSTTDNAAVSWWKVDMGGMYPVREILIYGRQDGTFVNFRIC